MAPPASIGTSSGMYVNNSSHSSEWNRQDISLRQKGRITKIWLPAPDIYIPNDWTNILQEPGHYLNIYTGLMGGSNKGHSQTPARRRQID